MYLSFGPRISKVLASVGLKNIPKAPIKQYNYCPVERNLGSSVSGNPKGLQSKHFMEKEVVVQNSNLDLDLYLNFANNC